MDFTPLDTNGDLFVYFFTDFSFISLVTDFPIRRNERRDLNLGFGCEIFLISERRELYHQKYFFTTVCRRDGLLTEINPKKCSTTKISIIFTFFRWKTRRKKFLIAPKVAFEIHGP